jgi:TatD DNase family protein
MRRPCRLCSGSCFSSHPYVVIPTVFLDSHAHLDGAQFAADREATIQRAYDAGVRALLAIGNGDGPDDIACAIFFAEQYPWIYASIGVHPHEARLLTPAHLVNMERLSHHPKVIAVGEIGLDYWYDHSPRDVQQQVFRQQLSLAAAVKLPILIHCRPSLDSNDAWDDLLAILRKKWAATGLGGVMHCFTGNLAQAQASLDLGFVLSFAGNISYPKAQNIRDAAAMVPLDCFFLETDCPYLAPVPHRGKRNEPAYVVETSRHFARLRNLTPEAAGQLALDNFLRFFNLPTPLPAPVKSQL